MKVSRRASNASPLVSKRDRHAGVNHSRIDKGILEWFVRVHDPVRPLKGFDGPLKGFEGFDGPDGPDGPPKDPMDPIDHLKTRWTRWTT